jgi:hypothetical protein
MDKTQQALIEAYLANETKLYQDWYKIIHPPKGDTDTLEVAPPLSLDTLKKRFKQWFEEQQEIWREKICIEWDYPRKRKEYNDIEQLIAALVDFVATDGIALICILVIEGYLDRLCADVSQE